jgi:hypothetical protein
MVYNYDGIFCELEFSCSSHLRLHVTHEGERGISLYCARRREFPLMEGERGCSFAALGEESFPLRRGVKIFSLQH